MPIHENLTVQYHQQDTDYYCGAACAHMVLESIGAGILDQDDLYADNHSHSVLDSVNWYTAPDGLAWTMNDRRPATFANSFVLFALANEDAMSRKICWTIHHYQVAPSSLVYGWAHWIVVRGFDASAAPSHSGDTGYTIDGFYVNNPWPPTPGTAAEPPHLAGDGCGSGGDRGVANEHITYATWQDDYMTGVPSGYWAGKFVSVCDPEPPADRIGRQQRPERLRGDRLISAADAARRATAGMKEHGLDAHWKKALQNTSAGQPMLVQRLDRPDSYYYVVPYQLGNKRVPVMASVDARYGNYRQAIALPEGRSSLLLAKDTKKLIQPLVGRKLELADRQGRILLRPEAMVVSETLVWRPCRESLSPFWPFRMITMGPHRIYVRIDGQVFTKLHDDPGI